MSDVTTHLDSPKRHRSALVTGATGFVGNHLAERLLLAGWSVRLLVRDSNKLTPTLRAGCELITGDLIHIDAVSRAVRGVDVIFHCAANVSTWDTHDAYYAANVVGVQNLLHAIASENKTLPPTFRLVHVSTMDVYGFPELPCTELSATTGGGFGYGVSKLQGENVVRELADKSGISYAIIRPGNVIGPGSQFITRIGAELKFGIMLTVDGGREHAGLVYIDNLVDCLIWAADAPAADRACFNVRDDYDVDWATFISTFRRGIKGKGLVLNMSFAVADKLAGALEALHKTLLPRFEPMLHRLIVRFFGRTCGHSADKIHAYCKTRISFEVAMQESISWFLKQGK